MTDKHLVSNAFEIADTTYREHPCLTCGHQCQPDHAALASARQAERQRIYAADNFPGDGSVGPDEIPEGYRNLDATYWYRRWLWTMNRLDEAPTAWDIHAAKREARDDEQRRIRQRVEAKSLYSDGLRISAGELRQLIIADLLDGAS